MHIARTFTNLTKGGTEKIWEDTKTTLAKRVLRMTPKNEENAVQFNTESAHHTSAIAVRQVNLNINS